MILYATKQTIERYSIPMPEDFVKPMTRAFVQGMYERECGDKLLEWGVKLFYFNRCKCLQVCNFASKFTLILADWKKNDLQYTINAIVNYMLDIYSDDKETTKLLDRLFKEHPDGCFARLTDKSVIATLNHMQSGYLEDGYRLYDFVEGNVLQTKKLNKTLNTDRLARKKVNGKEEFYFPADEFAALLKARYAHQ